MNKSERQDKILELINSKGIVQTKEINSLLADVTPMTLNRDLRLLLSAGLIHKVSLGYSSLEYFNKNSKPKIVERILFANEKNKIAKKVTKIIEKNDVIYFSPGTTSKIAVKEISKPCVIYTNSYAVYQVAKENSNVKAVLIGGEDKHNKNIFVGIEAAKTISSLHFNKVFLSIVGISEDGFLLNSNQEESLIESTAAINAQQIAVIADLSKMSAKGNYKFFSLQKCDYLIVNDLKKLKLKFDLPNTKII
ncbi:DeoR/GlpR family DNA-binding transcription regulator [Candidatus Mycoplasma pogonae]